MDEGKVVKRRSVPAFAWRESGKTTLSVPDRDSNLNLPVIDCLLYCKSSVLDHVATEVGPDHPEQNLDCLLGFQLAKTNESLPDLYVVGEVLASRDYVKVKTVRLQGTVISLFCLRKHLLHLRDIETQYTKTGFGGMWGNKGAVSIRLGIYGCSVCLVNCHLTPHDHLLQERVTDYNTIIKSQSFQAKETTNILYHDYVFWIGDLNFRLLSGLSATEIEQLVEKGELTRLLAKDQLRHVIDTGEAFSELVENLPTFPPTYKFEFHTSKYDLKFLNEHSSFNDSSDNRHHNSHPVLKTPFSTNNFFLLLATFTYYNIRSNTSSNVLIHQERNGD
uniref:Inositol polyphosphate-related phosphatase domain-containing protein n=1 Tax=Timema tahoe TaxID=61484 RepID=A0A7R9NW66_9NEOP|nr:unnamed protein product [Timema tahoe]